MGIVSCMARSKIKMMNNSQLISLMDQLRTAVREICAERGYNVEIIDMDGGEFQINRKEDITAEMVENVVNDAISRIGVKRKGIV